MDTPTEIPEPILVPMDVLNEETLHSVLESFILREGTDYGAVELTIEAKLKNLQKQIDKEEIVLVFDPATESLTLMSQREWMKIKGSPK